MEQKKDMHDFNEEGHPMELELEAIQRVRLAKRPAGSL